MEFIYLCLYLLLIILIYNPLAHQVAALQANTTITAVFRLRHGTKLLRRIQTVLVAVAMPTSQQQTSTTIIKLPPQQIHYNNKQQRQQQIPPQTPLPIHTLLHLPTTAIRVYRRRRFQLQPLPRHATHPRYTATYQQVLQVATILRKYHC